MTAVETLTILFTDLVDSTAISVALEPAVAADLRVSLFALQREEIERVGGRQVKSLGDGVMAVFPNASSGLSAAVAVQRRVALLDRRFPMSIKVRIGLSAGDVELEDGDYYGEPVVEAARLCALASPGSIQVVELVRLLAGRSVAVTFGDPVPRELKGLPDPVPTCEVDWDDVEVSQIPFLWPSGGRRQGPFIGRSDEVARFVLALDGVREGQSRTVVLTGEPGVGKSRTAEELALAAYERGALVLAGRAREELPVPFGPFLDALAHLVAHVDAGVLEEHVVEHGAELSRLVPELASRMPDLPPLSQSDPETERFRLYRAVVGLLADAASGRPIVLVLDDLQDADRSTIQLTRFLAAEAVAGLLILAVFRTGELPSDHTLHDLRAEQMRAGRLVALDLDGLDTDHVTTLIEYQVGHPLPPVGRRAAETITRETDGNPFFVGEVVRHLIELGVMQRDGTGQDFEEVLSSALPDSVVEVVRRRIRRLGDDVGRVLGAAAVLGLEFEPKVLAEVAGVDGDRLIDVLDEAAAAEILRPTGTVGDRCAFTHGIVAHTLYDDLSGLRRAHLHRRAAAVLAARHAHHPDLAAGSDAIPEIARHAYEGRDRDSVADAIEWVDRAASSARDRLAPDEAMRWYRRALRMASEADAGADVRCALMLDLGVAERDAGAPTFRDTLRRAGDLARELGSPALVAEAALANFRGFWSASGSVDEERIDELQAAREGLGDVDDATTARILATTAVELGYYDDVDERLKLADDALAMARRLGQPATLAYLLRTWELVHRLPWYLEERTAVAAEHYELAHQLDDPVERFWAVNSSSIVSLERGDAGQFFELVERVLPAAAATGQRLLEWIGGFVAVNALVIRGRFDDAEALMERTHEVGVEAGMPDADAVYASHLFELRRAQGRVDELVDLLVAVQAASPEIEAFRPAVGICYRDLDRSDGHDLFREDVADHFARYRHNGLWLASMSMNAEIAAFFDDVEAADQLYPILSPWRDQIVWTGTSAGGSVAGALAGLATTLGRFDEAEALAECAVDLHRRFDAPVWTAASLLTAARLFAVRGGPGDRERALDAIDECTALAGSVGCSTVVDRASALADSMGSA